VSCLTFNCRLSGQSTLNAQRNHPNSRGFGKSHNPARGARRRLRGDQACLLQKFVWIREASGVTVSSEMGGKEMEATRRRQRQEAEHADPGPQSTMRLQESQSAPDFSVADRNLTFGSRITPAERSVLRQYAGIIFAVLLICGASYLFLVAQKEKRETTGFDPNRPVPSDTVLRRRLTPEEYSVVREHGSQMPFRNEYWNTQRTGIYVDVITGQPLFTSLDKYDSNLGIPSFSKPIAQDLLVERPDNSEDMQRTEVLAKRSNAHLGYLFSDPQSPTGRRYSIYSAALHFIPKAEMKDKAYEAYLPVLEKK